MFTPACALPVYSSRPFILIKIGLSRPKDRCRWQPKSKAMKDSIPKSPTFPPLSLFFQLAQGQRCHSTNIVGSQYSPLTFFDCSPVHTAGACNSVSWRLRQRPGIEPREHRILYWADHDREAYTKRWLCVAAHRRRLLLFRILFLLCEINSFHIWRRIDSIEVKALYQVFWLSHLNLG